MRLHGGRMHGRSDPHAEPATMPTDLTTDPRATNPTPITEERWWDALECLPPMDWRRAAGAETFAVPEPYDVDPQGHEVFWRYVRIGARYWKMLSHRTADIHALARACLAAPQESCPDSTADGVS